MTAILLTHAKGATISTIDFTQTTTLRSSTSLPIPSRFPPTSIPQTSVSPSGHIYLWCPEINIVWEYDSRARRVGEIVVKHGPVKRVLGAGVVDGKEMVVVHMARGLGIWSKGSGGKWESVKVLEAPADLAGLAADSGCKYLAALGTDELLIYNMNTGERDSIFLGKELYREPAVALAISSECVLVASTYNVLRVTLSRNKREIREINAGGEEGKILALCTVPASGGSTESCAVLREGGQISLCGLDAPDSVTRTVKCAQALVDLAPFGPGQLVGRTAEGKVFVQNINTPSTVSLSSEQVITAVHMLQTPSPASAPSSRVRRSASASVLGESRNVGNIPPPSKSGSSIKGKIATDSAKSVRVVSAPSHPQMITAPAARPLSSRSTSQPVSRQLRPSSSMGLANLPAIQDIEEEEDLDVDSVPARIAGEQSLDLGWALQAPPAAPYHTVQSALEVNTIDELRREISNLQLDMLRMGRGLKNEIRNAIKPLVDELRESRETNERQRLEIEILRRGF